MSDELRREKRRTGQAPSSRDRVGGGMQRSEAKPPPQYSSEEHWEPDPNCDNNFHFVRFINGEVEIACKCLTMWYKY